jgi:hypothetical protein
LKDIHRIFIVKDSCSNSNINANSSTSWVPHRVNLNEDMQTNIITNTAITSTSNNLHRKIILDPSSPTKRLMLTEEMQEPMESKGSITIRMDITKSMKARAITRPMRIRISMEIMTTPTSQIWTRSTRQDAGLSPLLTAPLLSIGSGSGFHRH